MTHPLQYRAMEGDDSWHRSRVNRSSKSQQAVTGRRDGQLKPSLSKRNNLEMTWQPIETYKKHDHLPVVIWVPGSRFPVIAARYGTKKHSYKWQNWWAIIPCDNPTHWMPLPEPPKLT